MSAIQTIAGIVSHVGAYTSRADMNTYSRIELHTVDGLIVLENVAAPGECASLLRIAEDVAITMTQCSETGGTSVIWAVRDVAAGVTATNRELFAARDAAVAESVFFTLASFVLIPVGLALLVAPGFYVSYKLVKAWASALAVPSKEEIEASVAALDLIQPPEFALAA
ncbi:hypothetical protein ABIC83_003067 [Roseateles asaccharophilus]|uniref:hypothetical protein n=1 Tax=Roseateles asaccharophilus TaxID=582607 RepID=UPI003833F794